MEKISNFGAKGMRGRCNYLGIKEKIIAELLEVKLKTLLIGNSVGNDELGRERNSEQGWSAENSKLNHIEVCINATCFANSISQL
jgi:hypothetical protein